VTGDPLISAHLDTSDARWNGRSGGRGPSDAAGPVDIEQWTVATHAELQDRIESLTHLQRSRSAHLRSRLATPASGLGLRHQDQRRIDAEGRFSGTELLLLAEHSGAGTAVDDRNGIRRMLRRFAPAGWSMPSGRFARTAGGTILVRKLVRYGTVSLVSTAISLTVLGVLVTATPVVPGWANVIAVTAGIIPSFELNRRWVWRRDGKRSANEILPFAALTFAGLGLSTLAVSVIGRWASRTGLTGASRTFVIEAANIAAFGVLWVAQFFVLDRALFGRHGNATESVVTTEPVPRTGIAA
jgi:putative flippase GtrA